jgi:single-strand DNA-binding protein
MSGIEAAFFGALGRDAEAKTSKSGKNYLRLNVRVGDGDAVQWVSVMVFGDEVPELALKLRKGARVYVEGSIKLDQWTAQDGTKRHSLNVLSWHCRLASIGHNKPARARDNRDRKPSATAAATGNDFHNDEIPF